MGTILNPSYERLRGIFSKNYGTILTDKEVEAAYQNLLTFGVAVMGLTNPAAEVSVLATGGSVLKI